MAWQFNTPPGWPAGLDRAASQPGWQPNPSWGPAPEGWVFWHEVPEPHPRPGFAGQAPARRRPSPALILSGVGLAVVAAFIGHAAGYEAGENTTPDAVAAAQVAAEARTLGDREKAVAAKEAALTVREGTVASAESSVKQAKELAALTTIPGEGTVLVGKEIQPGIYRSPGRDGCYWKRLSAGTGTYKDIIASDHVDGATVVEILAADFAFTAEGCTPFEKIG